MANPAIANGAIRKRAVRRTFDPQQPQAYQGAQMTSRKSRQAAFRMVELGKVTRSTKGVFLLLLLDGGDFPFDRELPFW